MTVDRFIIFLAVLCALLVAHTLRVDAGMEDVKCGPNGQGGKTCVYAPEK